MDPMLSGALAMGVMFFSLQPAKSAAMHSSSPENVAPRKTPVMLFFFLYSILSLFLFIIE